MNEKDLMIMVLITLCLLVFSLKPSPMESVESASAVSLTSASCCFQLAADKSRP
jgi:hypothetical protein